MRGISYEYGNPIAFFELFLFWLTNVVYCKRDFV